MYAVTAYASWLDVEARNPSFHATYPHRSAAMQMRVDLDLPIVDVRDIGEAGYCPGSWGMGHRFTADRTPTECLACGAWADDLYVPGTYIPKPGDVVV